MRNEINTARYGGRVRIPVRWRHLLPIGAVLALSACSEALIYGESTSFSVASVKLNDNVAEPIGVNVGLKRTVAALAPSGENGDSVNMVAGFALDHTDGGWFGVLNIRTEFASGEAGKDLAENNPKAAARIMNLSLNGPDPAALDARKKVAIAHITQHKDAAEIAVIAKALELRDGSDFRSIIDVIDRSDESGYERISQIIHNELPLY